jgi:dephospho-CoA kinase
MYVLGIVGGVASGKSAVAAEFARLGAVVLDADQVGHEVLRDTEVIAAFRQRWGDDVIGPDGQVVRRAVAQRVFGDGPEQVREREFLDSVAHPRIGRLLSQRVDELRAAGTSVAVIDAALLYETAWNRLCNGVAFVDVPLDLRRQRALDRRWSAQQFAAREASQWSVEDKKSRAQWVIDNGGGMDLLPAQVERIWSQITEA